MQIRRINQELKGKRLISYVLQSDRQEKESKPTLVQDSIFNKVYRSHQGKTKAHLYSYIHPAESLFLLLLNTLKNVAIFCVIDPLSNEHHP